MKIFCTKILLCPHLWTCTYRVVTSTIFINQLHVCKEFLHRLVVFEMGWVQLGLHSTQVHRPRYNLIVVRNLIINKALCFLWMLQTRRVEFKQFVAAGSSCNSKIYRMYCSHSKMCKDWNYMYIKASHVDGVTSDAKIQNVLIYEYLYKIHIYDSQNWKQAPVYLTSINATKQISLPNYLQQPRILFPSVWTTRILDSIFASHNMHLNPAILTDFGTGSRNGMVCSRLSCSNKIL